MGDFKVYRVFEKPRSVRIWPPRLTLMIRCRVVFQKSMIKHPTHNVEDLLLNDMYTDCCLCCMSAYCAHAFTLIKSSKAFQFSKQLYPSKLHSGGPTIFSSQFGAHCSIARAFAVPQLSMLTLFFGGWSIENHVQLCRLFEEPP